SGRSPAARSRPARGRVPCASRSSGPTRTSTAATATPSSGLRHTGTRWTDPRTVRRFQVPRQTRRPPRGPPASEESIAMKVKLHILCLLLAALVLVLAAGALAASDVVPGRPQQRPVALIGG